MGLDNIPNVYPCKKAGTAILDDEDRVDCEKTKAWGGCVYDNQKNSNPLVSNLRSTYGMFGVDCWYRGKYGNMLLDYLNEDPPLDFFGLGTNPEGKNGIPVEDCLTLSSWMSDRTEAFAYSVKKYYPDDPELVENYIKDWIFAAWWLKFVAEFADGSDTWY